ncbi:hypothetical protein EON80_07560, partial [bacterium]
ASATPDAVNEGFSSLIPSAFDFDNFDLPGIQEEGLSTVSTPVPPAAPPAAPPVAAASFTPATPPPPAPFDSQPASFGFEDDSLASKGAEEEPAAPAADPFAFDLPPVVEAPVTAAPAAAPVAETTEPDFSTSDFGLTEPEPTPAAAPSLEKTSAPAPAPQDDAAEDDFDLDSIFGDTPATAAATPSLAKSTDSDQFDLSGIETDLGSFAGGQTDDFTAFGAGLEDGASTDAATLYGLIYPALEELSIEVRRSLEFHLGRYPDATISRLVLLGGGAKLRNIDVFFTQSLGVPTVVANPFSHITVNTPKLPPEYATENGPLCTVALGLALRDFVD